MGDERIRLFWRKAQDKPSKPGELHDCKSKLTMYNIPTGKLIRTIMLGFAEFEYLQKGGFLTVNQCCERLGISRSTWYKRGEVI